MDLACFTLIKVHNIYSMPAHSTNRTEAHTQNYKSLKCSIFRWINSVFLPLFLLCDLMNPNFIIRNNILSVLFMSFLMFTHFSFPFLWSVHLQTHHPPLPLAHNVPVFWMNELSIPLLSWSAVTSYTYYHMNHRKGNYDTQQWGGQLIFFKLVAQKRPSASIIDAAQR